MRLGVGGSPDWASHARRQEGWRVMRWTLRVKQFGGALYSDIQGQLGGMLGLLGAILGYF